MCISSPARVLSSLCHCEPAIGMSSVHPATPEHSALNAIEVGRVGLDWTGWAGIYGACDERRPYICTRGLLVSPRALEARHWCLLWVGRRGGWVGLGQGLEVTGGFRVEERWERRLFGDVLEIIHSEPFDVYEVSRTLSFRRSGGVRNRVVVKNVLVIAEWSYGQTLARAVIAPGFSTSRPLSPGVTIPAPAPTSANERRAWPPKIGTDNSRSPGGHCRGFAGLADRRVFPVRAVPGSPVILFHALVCVGSMRAALYLFGLFCPSVPEAHP